MKLDLSVIPYGNASVYVAPEEMAGSERSQNSMSGGGKP